MSFVTLGPSIPGSMMARPETSTGQRLRTIRIPMLLHWLANCARKLRVAKPEPAASLGQQPPRIIRLTTHSGAIGSVPSGFV